MGKLECKTTSLLQRQDGNNDGGSSCRIVREEGEIVSIDFEMLWVDKNAGISV